METLVIVSQYRNQYESRSNSHGSAPLGSFGSSPSKTFNLINCRTFQSGAGLLPTPLKPCTTAAAANLDFSPTSPKTPCVNSVNSLSEEPKGSKRFARSNAVSIPIKLKPEFVEVDNTPRSFNEHFNFSELWAGPAYSNSPPPSSLPIPKFSFRTKRTVSLELPSSAYDIDLHPLAKSAPTSPTSERRQPFGACDLFCDGNVSATKDLCRILNLDITDD